MADLLELHDDAKQLQGTLVEVAGVIGLVAGALGLGALIYSFFAKPQPVAATKPGCNTCGG